MTDPEPAWSGGTVGSSALCVLAPNPGPMTLDGTNTWVLAHPHGTASVVVDPGPDDPGHLAAVLAAARAGGRRLDVVLLTHGHPDHADGARRLAAAAGVGVRALDPAHRLGTDGLTHGEHLEVEGLRLQVIGTPGHTSDSLSFLLLDEGALLTGDTVLGRGSTVVAYPDGQLGEYLESLRRLHRLAAAGTVQRILPGHGPDLPDPRRALARYLAHRQERLAQVADAVAEGYRSPAAIVAHVYGDVDRSLWPAAELSVRAQLNYLRN